MRLINKKEWQCPVCHNAAYSRTQRNYSQFGLLRNSKLVTCADCHAKSVFPMPSEEDLNVVNNHYWSKAQHDDASARKFLLAQAEFRVKYLSRYIHDTANMKILDVGSGHAYIFDVLSANNIPIDYVAVETDRDLQKELKSKGIRVYSSCNSISESDFDLIILSHVLEHIMDPVPFFKNLLNLLAPNGHLFVEVPNKDDIFKSDLGLHLLVFNQHALNKLFEFLRVDVIDMVTVGENIHKLRPSNFAIFKTRLKMRSPWLFELGKFIKRPASSPSSRRSKRTIENCKFDHFNDDGRWLRAIVKKKPGITAQT